VARQDDQTMDMLQGTLDMLILKALSLEPMHGWGVTERIQQCLAPPSRSIRGRSTPPSTA
jgi:hypothetical protein